jgi:hypothetical protein
VLLPPSPPTYIFLVVIFCFVFLLSFHFLSCILLCLRL